MKIVCFGDSNTWGYDPCSKFGEPYTLRWTDILSQITGWTVINEGLNGREVPHERATFSPDADLYIIMLGTNDLLQLDTPESTAQRMEHFLSGCNVSRTVVVTPPPMKWGEWVQDQGLIDDSIRLTQLYMEIGEHLNIRVLDTRQWNIPLAYDGVHFTEDAQFLFARKLADALICLMQEEYHD